MKLERACEIKRKGEFETQWGWLLLITGVIRVWNKRLVRN